MCRLHDIPDNIHIFLCRLDIALHMFLDNIHNFMCRYELTKIVFLGEMTLNISNQKYLFRLIPKI